MKNKLLYAGLAILALASCNNKNSQFDATGTFEADEVLVSSEIGGKILEFNVEEGQTLAKDSPVLWIDARYIALQKEQAAASIEALQEKTADVNPQVVLLQNQISVQQSRLDNLLYEQKRVERLYESDAATGKQLDDIKAQIDQVQKEIQVTDQQIKVQKSQVATQNRSVLSEQKPLSKRVEQLDDQLQRSIIFNPVTGTVLAKYAEAGEITSPGRALYKIADLSEMTLRAYITGDQLPLVRLGQSVKIWVDDAAEGYRELPGIVQWVSDKAEFTPKTIQTKNERANLVYAIKIKVKNDGTLKIGMYGEVSF